MVPLRRFPSTPFFLARKQAFVRSSFGRFTARPPVEEGKAVRVQAQRHGTSDICAYLCATLLLLAWIAASPVAAYVTPPGTIIENTATFEYQDARGVQQPTVTSNVAPVVVDGVAITSLEGQVTDADTGVPLIGATVNVYSRGAPQDSTLTVAPWGIYEFDRTLAPGTYQVIALCPGYAPSSKIGVAISADATTYVNFFLIPASNFIGHSQLTGHVTDAATGAPLVGATILAFRQNVPASMTETDASGSFVMTDLKADSYSVDALSSGYVTAEQRDIWLLDGQSTWVEFALAPW